MHISDICKLICKTTLFLDKGRSYHYNWDTLYAILFEKKPSSTAGIFFFVNCQKSKSKFYTHFGICTVDV